MDATQQRIADDLAGLFEGELRFDRVTRSLYSTDGSLYQLMPIGVATPRHADDVAVLARYAEEANLPLVPRGAGTGLAGGALGNGLIVDFSRYMTGILEIGDETVRVQPGVVRDHLNAALREHGRYFPPDPANSAVTTIGGMLGVDAAGAHAVRVGSTRDHVRSLQVVLAGGHRIEFGTEPRPDSPPSTARHPTHPDDHTDAVRRRVVSRLTHLLASNQQLIQEWQPALTRNCAGYQLRGALTERWLHVPRVLVGSEGTLGMFTAVTLHTAPLPPHRGVALLLFGGLDAALSVVREISEQQPSACDLLDRRLLSLGREADPRFATLIPQSAEAALIVEQTGFTAAQAQQRLRMAIASARAVSPQLRVAAEAHDPDDIDFLWSLPQRVVPNLVRLQGETRPQPFIEDFAVPPGELADVVRRVQRVLQARHVTASLYAHAASGQIHLRPFLPLPSPADGRELESLAREVYDVVLSAGGTISGEHGDGISRTSFLRDQYGPMYRLFREVKDIFDPHNLLNPGKIVSDDPGLSARNFRALPTGTPAAAPDSTLDAAPQPEEPQLPLLLTWEREELSAAALRCNGCGVCRTHEADSRMCPLFRLTPLEDATPRAKANAMRNQFAGILENRDLASEEMKQLANLCFNCKQCQMECPANVDVPHLMIEAKAQYVAAHGLKSTDWILSRAHSFGALGSLLAPVSNWGLNSRVGRWLLEKMGGIARERKLPRFASRSFLRSVRKTYSRRPASLPRNTVIYFVDHFANFHDPQIAWAFVRLLEALGYPVYVPPDQTASGMAMISAGDLDAARKLAEENVRTLGPLAREGHPIVCTEPASVIALTQEYPYLLNHPDVAVLAGRVQGAGEFLRLALEQNPTALHLTPLPLRAAYHTPCHSRVMTAHASYLDLLRMIPELRIDSLDLGCSGMAGAYGLTRENFEASLTIGRPLIERMAAPDLQIGLAECSSCKLQMEQGTSTPTLHPLKILALAGGLMPEVRLKLVRNRKRLLVS